MLEDCVTRWRMGAAAPSTEGLKFLPSCINDQRTNALRECYLSFFFHSNPFHRQGRAHHCKGSERESPYNGVKGTDEPIQGERVVHTHQITHRNRIGLIHTSGRLSLRHSIRFSLSTFSTATSGLWNQLYSRTQLPSKNLTVTGRFSSRLILPALRIVVVNTVFAMVGSPCLS